MLEDLYSVKGKVIVITGGSGILGGALAQHLIQAKIALSLADQESWQLQLTAAVQKLKSQLPNQDELRQQVFNLSQQTVVPDLPEGINFQAIINELTRLN